MIQGSTYTDSEMEVSFLNQSASGIRTQITCTKADCYDHLSTIKDPNNGAILGDGIAQRFRASHQAVPGLILSIPE